MSQAFTLDALKIVGLLDSGWEHLAFEPFRPGVGLHQLYSFPSGASAAVLHYQPGARVPLHEHPGVEVILVLEGVQEDEAGSYAAGTFAVNAPGSRHRVWSKEGCVVLVIWERPVIILE